MRLKDVKSNCLAPQYSSNAIAVQKENSTDTRKPTFAMLY